MTDYGPATEAQIANVVRACENYGGTSIIALAGVPAVDVATLRRNVVVSGINLVALKNARVRVGSALLEIVGPCQPCSRMEEAVGPGGYAAMRGHGGMTARVLEGGALAVGDAVRAEQD